MLTIKNFEISLYCHFNKIIKEPGISFQFPVQSKKHVRNVCLTAYQYLTKFLFQSAQDSTEISINGNFTTSNAYDDTTDFKTVDFTKARKSRCFLENKILFFLQIKKVGIPKPCTNLHPAHFSLHQALWNTLNVIRTKILHVIGQFPQIQVKKCKVFHFDRKLAHMVSWRC